MVVTWWLVGFFVQCLNVMLGIVKLSAKLRKYTKLLLLSIAMLCGCLYIYKTEIHN